MTVGTLVKILQAVPEKDIELMFCTEDGAGPFSIDRMEISQIAKDNLKVVLVGELNG